MKGFTLIELMIVIIIIGVLATIGIVQYQAAVEKSRGAEARQVLGFLRKACAPVWVDTTTTTGCDSVGLGIGTGANQVPSSCRSTNFFTYDVLGNTGSTLTVRGNRCTTGGKKPDGNTGSLTLTINFSNGSDVFNGSGGF